MEVEPGFLGLLVTDIALYRSACERRVQCMRVVPHALKIEPCVPVDILGTGNICMRKWNRDALLVSKRYSLMGSEFVLEPPGSLSEYSSV